MTSTTTYDPRFRVPGNMQIVGPSLSGKNHLAVPPGARRPRLFSARRQQPLLLPKNRLLLRLELATIFDCFRALGVHFQPGLPEDVAGLFPSSQARPGLLILDDLMQESAKSPQITQLLTRGTISNCSPSRCRKTCMQEGENKPARTATTITRCCSRTPPTPDRSKPWAIAGWETVEPFGRYINGPPIVPLAIW